MPRIALSYRRADSAAISGRIFDRLVQRYGAGSVFMDIDEIPFGIDFREHVSRVLSTCDAVVVVIGRVWTGGESAPRRIDQPTDPVRVEVQTALEHGIPVIPILVDDAAMPEEAALPEPLKPLAYRNACPVDTGRDFHAHVDRLIRSMDRMFGPENKPPTVEAAAPSPATVTAAPAGAAAVSQAPMSAVRASLLVAFLALPQAVQFTQEVPLFIVGLVVSVIGTATLLDREDSPVLARTVTAALVITVALVVQSCLGILRASFPSW